MEVGEENTSNHLQDPTTTALNEVSFENESINDDKVGKEVLEPNKEVQGEESPVMALKLDDSKPFLTVPVGETAAVEEVTVRSRNSESIVLESKVDDGANKDEIPNADVTDPDHGDSDLISAKIDGSECEAVIENDKQGVGGETESTKLEKFVPSLPVGEPEEVKTDVNSDDAVETVPFDEAEQIVGDEDKPKMADEDSYTPVGDTEIDKEEPVVANEDRCIPVGDTGIDEEEPVVAAANEDSYTPVGDTEIDKEEPVLTNEDRYIPVGDTEIDKEELVVAKEDSYTHVGDTEIDKEEPVVANEDSHTPVGDTEIDKEEPVVANEDSYTPVGDTEIYKEEPVVANEDSYTPVGDTELDKEEPVVANEDSYTHVGDTEIDKEEPVVANEDSYTPVGDTEIDKEEPMVANEDSYKPVGDTESDKEEPVMTNEDSYTPVGDTESDKEEPVVAIEDRSLDTDMETDEEKAGKDSPEQPVKTRGRRGRKRKRVGKTPQATPKSTGRGGKTIEEEDVCFVCYDGGDLVLCDKRNCPKAYHPSCINREEAFFQTKGRWDCGWHLCNVCSKKAEYMCYTCTFSLCKSCMKTNVLLCVREKEKKGFCDSCVETLMLIEESSSENQGNIDFNDKNSWEHLFKDYFTDMKAKLNISLSELVEAKNAWKGSDTAGKDELPAGHSDGDSGGSENPSENLERQTRKTRKRKSNKPKTRSSAAAVASDSIQWASKELLEFVSHMGRDTSYQSQFDVQALLLEYVKINKLRDSWRKSQIICDARLQGLFGKPRVGHFEMLKLLESHFLIKEDDDNQGSVVDTEVGLVDGEKTKDKKRKVRKKGDQEPQSNREDYAAINIHNINLIYLKRKLAEDLLEDSESFHSKIVGTFVRIRISGGNQNHDMYRLVQVTGTTTSAQYAVGKKTTDIMLEILNLDKTESISIDTISNQEFTEDECMRLRQSIKCGLIRRLTVGDILDKAIELQAARVNDWIETEVVRLSHLRDRASDLGRKKELRECVEKLEVLKTPEERARRLQDIPVIHDDPTMDPKYESEDDSHEHDKEHDMYNSSMDSRFSKRRNYPSKESWRGTGTSTSSNPGKSNDFSKKVGDAGAISPRMGLHNDSIREQGKDRIVQPPSSSVLKKPTCAIEIESSTKDNGGVSETEKLWHYKDPSGTIQGLFSLAQLRKWHNQNFFPVDLRIWRTAEKEKDGILLTDALEGRFTVRVERHGLVNLPSPSTPTPTQSSGPVGLTAIAGGNKEHNEMVQSGWSGGPLQAAVQNSAITLQQPPQPDGSWPTMSSNPNIGLVGPAAGNQTVNVPWGMQAGPGNVNYPGWVPPQPVSEMVPTQGWVGGPGPLQTAVQNPAIVVQQPPQPDGSWPTMFPNPNIGLTGPAVGSQTMNMPWGLQAGLSPNPNIGLAGPTAGNQTMNLPWGLQAGPSPNPNIALGGPTAGNQIMNMPWGVQAGPVYMNHPGWVPPQPVSEMVPTQGWVGGPGPTQVPIVSGGGSPRPRNGSEPYNRSRGGGSGFSGNRMHWEKQGSFNNRGR